jgi:type II secretory pathway component PulM
MNAVLDKQLAPLRLRWNGLQPRQRVVSTAGAAVLAVALLIAFVWLPLERYRASLQKRVPELRASLAAMERDAEEVKRADRRDELRSVDRRAQEAGRGAGYRRGG